MFAYRREKIINFEIFIFFYIKNKPYKLTKEKKNSRRDEII